MNIATSDWIFVVVLTVLALLFLGPGLWSNQTEMPIVVLWKRWRNKTKSPPDDDLLS